MTLHVRLVSAHLSHDTELLSNMDPYCYIRLGDQKFRSKTKKDAGKKPVWNEDFQFKSNESLLKVTVMDQDTFKDDLVGEGTINIANYRSLASEQQEIVQLYYHGRTAGKVVLVIRSGLAQNGWGNNNTANTWGNANQNANQPFNQGFSPNVNQGYNQPNQGQQPQGQWGQNAPNSFGSQGNLANSPWGNLDQNNGWGNFNFSSPNGPSYNSNPNIPPPQPPTNPMQIIGGFFNQLPPSNPQGFNGNPYPGNPFQ